LQLPIILEHLQSEQKQNAHRLAQVLKVGKHELEVSLEKNFSGVTLVDPPSRIPSVSRPQSIGGNYSWLWWVIGIAVILFLMIKK
jgi:hypothetical protein